MPLAQSCTIDLFDDSTNAASSEPATSSMTRAQALEPRSTLPPTERLDNTATPAPNATYTAFWRGYHATLVRSCEAIVEAGRTSPHLWSGSKGIGEAPDLYNMLTAARAEIVRDLVARAVQEFSPLGVNLSIDEAVYKDLVDKVQLVHFDPDAVWKALEGAYGGQKGQEHGFRQTAEQLVKSMSLRYTKPSHLKGRLDVKAQSWSEVRFNGKRQLTYTHCNTVFEALAALQGFCEWAEDQDTADAIRAFTRANRCYDIEVPQHSTFGAIGFRTRVSSITWSFTGAIADKFQAFISEFGQEALAPRD